MFTIFRAFLFSMNLKLSDEKLSDISGGATGGLGGLSPPNPKSRQKLSKKNGIRLVGYTFRLRNYVKIPFISLGFFRAGAATVGHHQISDNKTFGQNFVRNLIARKFSMLIDKTIE